MRKVTQKHQVAVNQIMLATISQYIEDFAVGSDEDVLMYADDVAYNSRVLGQFNKDRDAAKLHDAVTHQDTVVREYFIDVLRYIESNELVPTQQYVCA
jgi:hypothetical protein